MNIKNKTYNGIFILSCCFLILLISFDRIFVSIFDTIIRIQSLEAGYTLSTWSAIALLNFVPLLWLVAVYNLMWSWGASGPSEAKDSDAEQDVEQEKDGYSVSMLEYTVIFSFSYLFIGWVFWCTGAPDRYFGNSEHPSLIPILSFFEYLKHEGALTLILSFLLTTFTIWGFIKLGSGNHKVFRSCWEALKNFVQMLYCCAKALCAPKNLYEKLRVVRTSVMKFFQGYSAEEKKLIEEHRETMSKKSQKAPSSKKAAAAEKPEAATPTENTSEGEKKPEAATKPQKAKSKESQKAPSSKKAAAAKKPEAATPTENTSEGEK